MRLGPEQDFFANLPRRIKEQLKLPWDPPDMTELDAIDRDVHLVRVAIAGGTIEPQAAGEQLQLLGSRYLSWLSHNGYPVRVAWRIADLEELASVAGVQVDVERWKGLLDASMGKPPK